VEPKKNGLGPPQTLDHFSVLRSKAEDHVPALFPTLFAMLQIAGPTPDRPIHHDTLIAAGVLPTCVHVFHRKERLEGRAIVAVINCHNRYRLPRTLRELGQRAAPMQQKESVRTESAIEYHIRYGGYGGGWATTTSRQIHRAVSATSSLCGVMSHLHPVTGLIKTNSDIQVLTQPCMAILRRKVRPSSGWLYLLGYQP